MLLQILKSPALLVLALALEACAPLKQRPQASTLRSTGVEPAALDAKLAAQFTRYEAARKLALATVTQDSGTISRAEWEERLALPPNEALTAADVAALVARQDAAVAEAREKARSASKIDLERVREDGRTASFCAALPKGGLLHVHPWGTLDRKTVREILTKVNPTIDFAKLKASLSSPGGTGIIYPEEHARFDLVAQHAGAATAAYGSLSVEDRQVIEDLYFLPPGNHSFDRFTGTFTAISALTFAGSGAGAFDPEPLMWERFLERAAAHKVAYVEVSRFIVPKPQWFNSLASWAQKLETKHGVVIRLHASYARNKDPEFTRGKAKQLLAMPASNILVGVNFVADETAYPALEFGQTMYVPLAAADAAGSAHLQRTIHAGELGDVRNVRDSMLLGAQRVGHGVLLAQDPVTLEYARTQSLPIEVNLVSNRRLKVVEDLTQHPYLRYLRLGLPVSLSTDDEGIFESTIDDECLAAVGETDVTYDEMRRMAYNAVTTSFAEPAVRTKLKAKLDADFAAFEAAWEPAPP